MLNKTIQFIAEYKGFLISRGEDTSELDEVLTYLWRLNRINLEEQIRRILHADSKMAATTLIRKIKNIKMTQAKEIVESWKENDKI